MTNVIAFPSAVERLTPTSEPAYRVCWIDVSAPGVVLGAWFSEEIFAATLYAQLFASTHVERVEAAHLRGDGAWEPWAPSVTPSQPVA
jgi:hypothetical protein